MARKTKKSRKTGSKKKRSAGRRPARKTTTRRKPGRKKASASRRRSAKRGKRRQLNANPTPAVRTVVKTRTVRVPSGVSRAEVEKMLAENPRKKRSRRKRRVNENPRRRKKSASRRRARTSGRRRVNANPRTVIHLVNPWKGEPRRHAKAAKKGWSRRRRSGKAKRKQARRKGKARCTVKQAARVLGRRGGLHDNPMGMGLVVRENPEYGLNLNPLLPNESPFTSAGAMQFGLAALVTGVTFWVAGVVDRGVATRKPKGGKFAYFGAEAAAAQRVRPDAWRYAAQAVGALLCLVGAYVTRDRKVAPYLLGGGAAGFAGNGVKMLLDYEIAPRVLAVKPEDSAKPKLGNRLFPLEQDLVQKEISKLFQAENWKNNPNLVNAQTEVAKDQPGITPVVGGTWLTPPMMSLGGPESGKARANGDAGTVGSPDQAPRVFLNTGRLGNCPVCSGRDGCYSDCGTLCPNCPEYCPGTECEYEVQRGDDLAALAAAGGVSIEVVNALNGGSPEDYWIAGNTVKLPYGICQVVSREPEQPSQPEQPPPPVDEIRPEEPSQPSGGGQGPFESESVPTAPPPYTPPVVAGVPSILAGPRQGIDLFNFGLGEPEEEEDDD